MSSTVLQFVVLSVEDDLQAPDEVVIAGKRLTLLDQTVPAAGDDHEVGLRRVEDAAEHAIVADYAVRLELACVRMGIVDAELAKTPHGRPKRTLAVV